MQIVCAVPRPKAGGSLATAAYKAMNDPVLVERTIAATPPSTSARRWWACISGAWPCLCACRRRTIGAAIVTAARTRPPLIGGERARYTPED